MEEIAFKLRSFLAVDGSVITYECTPPGKVGCAQANRAFSQDKDGDVAYFEVTIQQRGRGAMYIGFAPRGFFRTGKQPGMHPHSYGWNGDDGKVYTASVGSKRSGGYDALWKQGDVVGCGVDFRDFSVFYTLNGKKLPPAFTSVMGTSMIPTVTLVSPDQRCQSNFGERPFVANVSESVAASLYRSYGFKSTPTPPPPPSSSEQDEDDIVDGSMHTFEERAPVMRTGSAIAADALVQSSSSYDGIVRIPPNYYIHVLNKDDFLVRLVMGPNNITLLQSEELALPPTALTVVGPEEYCVVGNPVKRDAKGEPVTNDQGYVVNYGSLQVRTHCEPFPLLPGEHLYIPPTHLEIVADNEALALRALRDFVDEPLGVERKAGETWHVRGPLMYIPRIEVDVVKKVAAITVGVNEALVLRALNDLVDGKGTKRKAGEMYLIDDRGDYLLGPDEEYVEKRKALSVTDAHAIRVRGLRSFTDVYGKKHNAGDEWLVTSSQTSQHTLGVDEKFVSKVPVVALSNLQYCIIENPCNEKLVPQFGTRELRRGPCQFFLHPGEAMVDNKPRDVYILDAQQALLLRATEAFKDYDGVLRVAGCMWMVSGPREYVPHVQSQVVELRTAVALDRSEGVYVKNTKTGHIRSVIGQTYMLTAEEEYWDKEMSPVVETLLEKNSGGKRKKHYVVTYRLPHNSATRVIDYNTMEERICFGPNLVMLEPSEDICVIRLSAGIPKVPNARETLHLTLGPDFMRDTFYVETSDHARLSLMLAYSWKFDIDKKDKSSADVFRVEDFVGDVCRRLASRVRATVARVTFDELHKNSSEIIKKCLLGEQGKPVVFASNHLCVMDVDVQGVEPVEADMVRALMVSVQQAIQITTDITELRARHEAARQEQEAKGKLQKQKLSDDCAAEEGRKRLLSIQAEAAALQSTGVAQAEAKAKAEAARIEGESQVEQAKMKAECERILHEIAMEKEKNLREQQLLERKQTAMLEIEKNKQLAQIKLDKFRNVMGAVKKETIQAMAQSDNKMKMELLQALGIRRTLFVSGNKPINLYMQGATPGKTFGGMLQ